MLLDVCDGGIFWSDALISTGVLVSEKGHPSWKAGHFSFASSTSSPALAKGHSLGGAAILLQQFGAPQQGSPNSKAGEGRRAGLRPPGAPVGPAKPCAVRRVEMRRALVQRKLAFFFCAYSVTKTLAFVMKEGPPPMNRRRAVSPPEGLRPLVLAP